MIKIETIAPEASTICPECKAHLKPQVLGSSAGFYIGTLCQCGPYSRDSAYYSNAEQAQKALDSGKFGR
ncbi:MAG: hypothetical protein ACLPN1_00965 [Dissulfurispiraceae bacterium]